ncbi:MAG: VOC family protein [Gemmatimonadota bacterium]
MTAAVRGISEIVLMVKNVKAAAAFYQDVVGLDRETEVTDEWAWFRMGPAEAPQRIAVHAGSLFFEEHSPNPPDKRWGQVHYALHVPPDRLEEAVARVRSHAIQVYGPVRLRWMEADAYYFYDPDGNLLELWSPDPAP